MVLVRIIRLLLIVILSLELSDARNKKSKSVTTLLEAKWRETPLVLEVAEYLSDENVDHYWSFIDSISEMSIPLEMVDNEKKQYDLIMDHAGMLITASQMSVLKLGLSLHVYSPKVEMFEQIASQMGLLNCNAVADLGGKMFCDVNEMKLYIDSKKYTEDDDPPELHRIDTHYPGSANRSLIAVLYGQLGTSDFSKFHGTLRNYAQAGILDYVVRHYVRGGQYEQGDHIIEHEDSNSRRLRLSGYGVELQMKSTEYKVQDDAVVKEDASGGESGSSEEEDVEVDGFNFGKLKSIFPDFKSDLNKFKQYLEETSSEMAPLKVWQFQELSLQAAQRIMNAPKDDALNFFTNIAQNFPMQAKGLVNTVVNENLKSEMARNQELFSAHLNLQPSDTALFINGLYYDLDVTDIYGLLDVIRQELRRMEGLHRIGMGAARLSALLQLEFGSDSSGGSGSSNSQEFALDIRDSAINWVNDIEADSKYSRWSSSLMDLLRPTFPGMLRQVRRNMFNLVLIINPIDSEIRGLLKLVESFVYHTAPIRVGFVFAVNSSSAITGLDDAGVAMLCAFNFISQKKSPTSALNFVGSVMSAAKNEKITVADIKSNLKENYNDDIDDILGEDSDYDFGRKLSADFIERSGSRSLPQVLLNGIPLPKNQLNVDDFEEAVLQEIMVQTSVYQKAIYRGRLQERDDIVDYIMSQPHVMTMLNERILTRDQQVHLDMTGTSVTSLNIQDLIQLSPRDMTATALENLKYFIPSKKTSTTKPFGITNWIIGNLACPKSKSLLLASLEQMKSSGDVRVTFLPNVDGESENVLNKIVLAALDALPADQALTYVTALLEDNEVEDKLKKQILILPAEVKSKLAAQELSLKMLRVYCQRVLNLKAGKRGVVSNGRVLGPFRDEENFSVADFALLEQFTTTVYGQKINDVLEKTKDEEEVLSTNSLMRIISLLISHTQSRSRFEMVFHGDEHSVIKIPSRLTDAAAFDISAVVDPVSRGAQKLGPILQTLQSVLNCNIKVFLNSVEKNSDMPLKSFYRFVLEPEIQFTEDGKQLPGPTAKFINMPQSPLLTQNMHVPENWLVEVVRSVYDLDNIRLENVDNNVHSEYELEHLLVEGHCFETTNGSPPRGLQITLGTQSKPVIVDTIVMANLGYFQLKANPGSWILRLRQGRSADIYDIVSHEGTDTPSTSSDIKVLLSSLRSNIVKLKVSKKSDKLGMDLLSEDDEHGGIWNSITSSFGSNDEDSEEKLNIFSLASGHLYERFIRIMMLSVLKNTKTPVKFWFLKNYLSPQIKDFLPYMAKQYGFEYELVQYKWPRWLHQQTEKQRIIWGYKILFLDVLFPLDVRKIIFVDADQVVRADMKELQQLDLGGAPYGYTPFCESRKEMDGFRFWKQGYWRNHLQGRRYHISALYVVDLKRFRRIAAGDRLRGQYQALSQDPNSLSNLDQDLPNNMIHQVAIKSLPQEWLWCETWCDEASKKQAKTIDLCNNPLTKEAKLTAAIRILPEWKGYDEEIRLLQQKIDSGQLDSDEETDPFMESTTTDKNVKEEDVHTEL